VSARTAAHVALGAAVAGQPVGAALERVARPAKETVPGVDEASVTLMKNGKPRTIAFTGPSPSTWTNDGTRRASGPVWTPPSPAP
jgi:hypothetical protein